MGPKTSDINSNNNSEPKNLNLSTRNVPPTQVTSVSGRQPLSRANSAILTEQRFAGEPTPEEQCAPLSGWLATSVQYRKGS